MKKIWLLVALSSVMPAIQGASTIFPADKIFISKVEAKTKELQQLKEMYAQLTQAMQDNADAFNEQLAHIRNEINAVKDALQNEPDNEFLSKKLVLLNDHYQVLKDYKAAKERLVSLIAEHVKLLEEYLADPDQHTYQKELGFTNRIAFSFEDLRQVKESIEVKKSAIEQLQQQEATTKTEIKSREQGALALQATYKEKKEEQTAVEKEFVAGSLDLNSQQHRELVNLEFALLETKKEVDDLQLKTLRARIKFIHDKIDIEETQLRVLKDIFARIKQSSIRISEADVAFARDELEKRRQELNALKIDTYEPKKDQLKTAIMEKEGELENASKQYNVPISEDLRQWVGMLKPTAEAQLGSLAVARLYEDYFLKRLYLEELDAQIEFDDQALSLDRVETDIKSSFYKMYTGKFPSEEKITEEIKRYEVRLADIQGDLSELDGKKARIEHELGVAKKALDTITQVRQGIISEKESIFKNNLSGYTNALELINEAEETVKKQAKVFNTIRSTYNDTVAKLLKTQQQVRFTMEELKASSRSIIWDRPEDAISWQGVKNIIPNVETFVRDVRSYVLHFDVASLAYKIKALFKQEYSLLYFVLYCIIWLMLLFFARMALPQMRDWLLFKSKGRNMPAMALFLATLLTFVINYFFILAFWVSCVLLLSYYVIPDPYPYILFYLLSIPLLLFLAQRFITLFAQTNIRNEYVFVGKEYQRRFMLCFSTLLYATIVIFFFREAFILANYPKSELPNILKALNIIILQISLIFLITKELVLSFIPRTNDVWIFIREQVDHYYYFLLAILIAIIVMMNPYVGFGRLVLFMLSRIIYTFGLIGVLFWLHGFIKRGSAALFFQTEQDTVKERFPSAKTWYGVSIIAILFFFFFIGAIIASKIWQWPDTLKNISDLNDILDWLKTPRLFEDTPTPISVHSILMFMFFMLFGVMMAAAIKRFVLSRIFDVLLVDSGVQNTVTSLTRYIILLAAIFLGFNAIGLGTQVQLMLYALLLGIGFIIKDPAADFVAYFVILVQRPIKIGDYIKINAEISGVVRKITARSVVLRRKNSTMIVVPNSFVINHAIVNWNYIRGFIAFGDIIITVAYKEDPMQVKEIFEKILDNSPYVLKNPKPIVRLDDFGPNGYEFMLRGFVSSNYTLDQWNIASDIRLQVVKVLREKKIELALPIRLMVNYQTAAQKPSGFVEGGSERIKE